MGYNVQVPQACLLPLWVLGTTALLEMAKESLAPCIDRKPVLRVYYFRAVSPAYSYGSRFGQSTPKVCKGTLWEFLDRLLMLTQNRRDLAGLSKRYYPFASGGCLTRNCKVGTIPGCRLPPARLSQHILQETATAPESLTGSTKRHIIVVQVAIICMIPNPHLYSVQILFLDVNLVHHLILA